METDTVFDHTMKLDRASALERLSGLFSGFALVLLVIGLVSQHDGQSPTINVVYWGTPWMIAWGLGIIIAVMMACICGYMRWEHLNPKPDVRPWHWYELASAAIVLILAVILIIALNTKVLLKM